MTTDFDGESTRSPLITLTGLRGSGKSTVGPLLAARLGWDFFDADDELERRTGRTIADIFAADGEPGFRAIERGVMADLLGRTELVIAAGGGTLMDEGTRERAARGFVVYLTAPPEVLARRVAGDDANAGRRPALSTAVPLDEMRAVFDRRDPIYRGCADLVVPVADADPGEIAATIFRELGAKRPGCFGASGTLPRGENS